MRLERGSGHVYVYVPIMGPEGWAPGSTTAELAFVTPGHDPVEQDWQDAVWEGEQVKLLTDVVTLPDGDYLVKVRLTAGLEQVVLTSGRAVVG